MDGCLWATLGSPGRGEERSAPTGRTRKANGQQRGETHTPRDGTLKAMSTPPPNTPNDQPRKPQQQGQPQSPAPNPQQEQQQGQPRPVPSRYNAQYPGTQHPGALRPNAVRPGRNPGKPPIDPLQRQRILLRTALALVASALLIFGASSFVLSPMPYFLGLFLFALVGLGLNIWAIVRTASARGPWIFYVAASLSILYSLMTVVGGIGLAIMPGMQEYRECRTAALTSTDMYTCDQMFQNSMDQFAGTGEPKNSGGTAAASTSSR